MSLSMAIWTQSYSIRHRVLSLICQSPYMVNLEIGLTVNTTGEWGGFLALLTRPVREKPYFGNHVWISRKSPRNQRDSSGNSVWVVAKPFASFVGVVLQGDLDRFLEFFGRISLELWGTRQ